MLVDLNRNNVHTMGVCDFEDVGTPLTLSR